LQSLGEELVATYLREATGWRKKGMYKKRFLEAIIDMGGKIDRKIGIRIAITR